MRKKWWADFFDETFSDLTREWRNEAYLGYLADFLIEKFILKKGSLLFDQCCGTGEISHALAKKGIRVIGVDQSKKYIAKARKTKLPCTFYAGDAFTFVTPEKCDAAVNWWTSFGLVEEDSQNIKMLKRVYESLKPGGWFALEYSNADYETKHFIERTEYKKRIKGGVLTSIREYKIDKARGMKTSRWTYRYPSGKTVKKYGETRLYTPKDITPMLRACGFRKIKILADIDGNKVSKDHPRFLCLAQKPPKK